MLESWDGVPIPYDRPVEELRQIIESGVMGERWASFCALAADNSKPSLELLSEYAGSSDPHIRRAAIEAIGDNQNGESLAAVIRNAMVDESPVVVRTALNSAIRLKLYDLCADILNLVESLDFRTQDSALRAIEMLWHPGCFDTVFKIFCSTPDDAVRKAAGFALHRNVDESHWKTLFQAWHADPLPRHRSWACELTFRFGLGEHQTELESLTTDSDGHVRKSALKALQEQN